MEPPTQAAFSDVGLWAVVKSAKKKMGKRGYELMDPPDGVAFSGANKPQQGQKAQESCSRGRE
eukprot:scaffold167943_cov13-Tisochrysis_lutea.AAC.1